MKKLIVFIIVIAIMISSVACSNSKDESVVMAESLIASIGEATIENENAVIFAENYYNTLSDSQKSKVSNYEVLQEARNSIDQAKADEEKRIAEEKAAEEARIEKEKEAEEARIKQEEEERKAAEEAARKAEEERKAAEEAARKAAEERKAKEDSIPAAPIEIKNISIKDYYSAKELYVQFTNTGNTDLEVFDFYVIFYDAYGNELSRYGTKMQSCTFDEELKAGGTSSSNYCWRFYNMDTMKTCKIAISKYKLKGKTTVEIPERKLIWVR